MMWWDCPDLIGYTVHELNPRDGTATFVRPEWPNIVVDLWTDEIVDDEKGPDE